SRLRDALNLADYRRAVEIFELDLKFRPATGVGHARVTADKSFRLEHLEHTFALPGTRHRNLRFVAHLSVADARDHVANRIVDCHRALPTSSTSQGLESGLSIRARATRYGSGGACGNSRAGAR